MHRRGHSKREVPMRVRVLWLAIGILGLVSGSTAAAATFAVNTIAAGADGSPGDGVCETARGSRVCTLRAAIEEANALPGADWIAVPAGTYVESGLTITGDLTLAAVAPGSVVIDGNGVAGVLR